MFLASSGWSIDETVTLFCGFPDGIICDTQGQNCQWMPATFKFCFQILGVRHCSSKPSCQGFPLLCLAMLLPQTRTKGTGIGEDLAARMPVIFKFCKDRDRDMEKGAAILVGTLSSPSR